MVTHFRARATLLALAAVVMPALAPGRASAEDYRAFGVSPSRLAETAVVEARRAFREGVNHARARRFEAAAAAFERSLALHPHAATLWNLATSELELGKLSAARVHYQAALRRAARDPGELNATKRTAAEDRLAELSLRIEGTATNSALPNATTTHSAPANATTTHSAPRRVIAADKSADKSARHAIAPRPVNENNATSPVQLPAFGLAAASAVSATIFGLLAVNAASNLNEMCPDRSRCPVGSNERRDELARYAMLADISLAVTLVAAGAGLYVTVVPPSSDLQSGGGVVMTHTF